MRKRVKAGTTAEQWIQQNGGIEKAAFRLQFMPESIEPQSIVPALLQALAPHFPEGHFRCTERWYFNGGKPFDWEAEKIAEDTRRQLEQERQQREGRQ